MALEEADQLQLLALTQAGISIPKSVKSAKDVNPEIFVSIVVRSLKFISPEDASIAALTDKLPANISSRHRIATAVAAAIKALGYPGEGGYNSLLYPNERDVRRLLSWIVQKLPRSDETGSADALGVGATLFRYFPKWIAGTTLGRGNQSPIPLSALAAQEREVAAAAAAATSGSTVSSSSSSVREAFSSSFRADVNRFPVDGTFTLSLCGREAIRAACSMDADASVGAGAGAAAGIGGTTSNNNNNNSNSNQLSQIPFPTLERVAETLSSLSRQSTIRMTRTSRTHEVPIFLGTHLDAHPSPFARRAAFAIKVVRNAAPPPQETMSTVVVVEAPKAKTEEEIHREREEELSKLQADIDDATAVAESLASKRQMLSALLPQLRSQLGSVSELTKELERSYLVRKAGLDMLPNADANLARMAAEMDAQTAQLLALGNEWEAHRVPLLNAILQEEAKGANQQSRAELLQRQVTEMRTMVSEIASGIAAKEEQERRLTAEVGKLQAAAAAAGNGPDAIITRPVYTRRILDIVRQIRKQKAEIARIVKDVRSVQADLTTVGEKVRKTASIATELMEKAAMEHVKDPSYRSALRNVVALQDAFSDLLAVVTSIGQAENETRDMENRIEQMQQRNDAVTTAALLKDLMQMRQENTTLQQKLGAK